MNKGFPQTISSKCCTLHRWVDLLQHVQHHTLDTISKLLMACRGTLQAESMWPPLPCYW